MPRVWRLVPVLDVARAVPEGRMTPEHALRALTARYDDGDGEGAQLAEQALARLAWRLRRGGKDCSQCGEALPLDAFAPRMDAPDGLRGICRACSVA